MPLALLALGAASIGLLVVTDWIRGRLVVQDTALHRAVGEIQTGLSTAHLWLEEYVTGDTVDLEEISAGLARASQLVEAMLTNVFAHFAVHTWLFVAATLMWMPVLSPTPAIPRLKRPMAMFYLFAQSLLPTIPASFLTFSSVPLYPIYGDASLAYGLSAVADQTIAGVIMKLGGGFLFWITIAVIWVRWTREERQWDELEHSLRAT